METGNASVHGREYEIRARDCGADGFVRDEALFEVLQEEAAAHADSLGIGFHDLLPAGRTWLLARMRLDLGRRPRYRERITVSTWPSGLSGLIALRDFKISGPDGERLAGATSSWLLVDFATRRPLRPEPMRDLLPSDPERILAADAAKLEDFPGKPAGRAFRVLASDLDVNGHVNNTVYVRMLEDFLAEGPDGRKPRSTEINFLGEAFLGDELSVWLGGTAGEAEGKTETLDAKLVSAKGVECARFRLRR